MGVTIVFGRVMGTPIDYPSKMAEQLILGKLKPNFTVLNPIY